MESVGQASPCDTGSTVISSQAVIFCSTSCACVQPGSFYISAPMQRQGLLVQMGLGAPQSAALKQECR